MTKTLALLALSTLPVFALNAHSDQPPPNRVDHYQAAKADSTEEVMANLREANAKLAALLAGEVDDYAIHDIHSLCYTLEDSLLRLSEEFQALHGIVADMHFASEGLKREAVIDYGEAYLAEIGKLLK